MANLIKETVYRTLFCLTDGEVELDSLFGKGTRADKEWRCVLQWSSATSAPEGSSEWSVVEVVCREWDDGTFTLE